MVPVKRILSILGFPALLALVGTLAFVFRDSLFGLFRSSESIRAWVQARGVLAPLAFMGLQVLQVVIFVIPGEIVQIAGGFAFGLWGGALWSILGILTGSLINFGVGRLLGRPFVESVFGPERISRVDAATAGGKAAAGFLLLFAIPGIPKDILTYAAGASSLPFAAFIAVSTLGRLPGILGSAYMGSAVYDKEFGLAIAAIVVSTALFALGLLFRDRLHALIARIIARSNVRSNVRTRKP
jgi:uncharacterized membrane protein YdjX (TVP38/TMEM64 family)